MRRSLKLRQQSREGLLVTTCVSFDSCSDCTLDATPRRFQISVPWNHAYKCTSSALSTYSEHTAYSPTNYSLSPSYEAPSIYGWTSRRVAWVSRTTWTRLLTAAYTNLDSVIANRACSSLGRWAYQCLAALVVLAVPYPFRWSCCEYRWLTNDALRLSRRLGLSTGTCQWDGATRMETQGQHI